MGIVIGRSERANVGDGERVNVKCIVKLGVSEGDGVCATDGEGLALAPALGSELGLGLSTALGLALVLGLSLGLGLYADAALKPGLAKWLASAIRLGLSIRLTSGAAGLGDADELDCVPGSGLRRRALTLCTTSGLSRSSGLGCALSFDKGLLATLKVAADALSCV